MRTSYALLISYLAFARHALWPVLAFTSVRFPSGLVRSATYSPVSTQRQRFLAISQNGDSLLDAEDDAAFDAHDLSDPAMEAAAMERAVMMAEEFKKDHQMIEHHEPRQSTVSEERHVAKKLGTDNDDGSSLLEAEDDAAFDAHDLSDPAMEAAAMERAVMMAEEFKKDHQMIEHHEPRQSTVSEERHVAKKLGTDNDDGSSLLEAEDDAAFDAHDLSDPAMEAAAMERAVMMAEEFKKDHQMIEHHEPRQSNVSEERNVAKQLGTDNDDGSSLLEAEDDAAFDAHDLSDPAMEAAAMERAVMMAEDMKKNMKK